LHFNEVFWFDQPTSSAKETSQQPSYDSPHVARAYRKHAFSVSGRFRQLLTDLIKTKHNSNHKTLQTTLDRKIVQEYHKHGRPAHTHKHKSLIGILREKLRF